MDDISLTIVLSSLGVTRREIAACWEIERMNDGSAISGSVRMSTLLAVKNSAK